MVNHWIKASKGQEAQDKDSCLAGESRPHDSQLSLAHNRAGG